MLGGGHSHLVALRRLHRQRQDLDLTLVSRHPDSVYSGMIPGVIAGHYAPEQARINLQRFCEQNGCRWRQSDIRQLDADKRELTDSDGRSIPYDVLSVNIGAESTPICHSHDSAEIYPVKPIDNFFEHWQSAMQGIQQTLRQQPNARPRLCIVGGGAAAVEVALAVFDRLAGDNPDGARRIQWQLISASPVLLPSHSRRVQKRLTEQLTQRGFSLHLNERIDDTRRDHRGLTLQSGSGRHWQVDAVIAATQVSGQHWLRHGSGPRLTENGFIMVNQQLQSLSHPELFAAGDAAHFAPSPLPKSGVYAVRQGRVLADNLLRWCRGQALHRYRPQRHSLSLIRVGPGRALASRGWFCAEGAWAWRWKDAIDRRFIAQFQSEAHR